MKLAISDKVTVPVKFTMKDGKKLVPFAFSVFCERLASDDFQERIKDDSGATSEKKIKELMSEITVGWENQTLVLDDDGQPAAFCDEARDLMFATTGVLDVVLASYMKESAARAKN
jgi:hypothetical protein